ncbi:MAG: tRNA (N6-isopentenyl adenosine(37)-C2)-methylthiotransferase MiaB [Lachnospiraceae bacterium]|nr:tRNA (N6-isopentenyl adenosine(37)-C2)-methylthiotransferase MiaB [Lachnospiraceae bacterium]
MNQDYLEELFNKIDISLPAPEREPERQYYFMKKLRSGIKEMSERIGHTPAYHVETFGCQMNAKDSEKLSGILSAIGFIEATGEKNADFVIYNTCTVRENANLKVYGRVGFLGNLKKKNPNMLIALCGCMMQEEHVVEKIRTSYGFVDLVFGTHNLYMFAELLYECLNRKDRKPLVRVLAASDKIVENLPSEQKFSFKAGVNISYGCNNFCTYCIVPYVRGREKSRRPDEIVAEVKRLVDNGVKEVMLLGQNVNSYGNDFRKSSDIPEECKKDFPELLKMVSEVPGLMRIRFMTPHPKDLSDKLIEEIANNPKVCKHVHLPMQSGSSRILQKMNRHYTKEDYLDLVKKIKDKIPGVALTTDIIVGFPGETEEDFEDTLDVVRQAVFSSAYTFQYSKRTGTPAASYPDQVPENVVSERFDRLLALIHETSEKLADKAVGSTVDVLVEEINESKDTLTGRMDNNMLVHFKGENRLLGCIVKVKLEECKGFYYTGSVLNLD